MAINTLSSHVLAAVVAAMSLCWPNPALQAATGQLSKALRIVVLDGENAVNIIQQNTAVAPLVEVRDENDQPVAGAVVAFSIRGRGAGFSGQPTLQLMTDTAGRATATGLTPTATGSLDIDVTATTLQGQRGSATISQTNFATAADAATAGRAGSGAPARETGGSARTVAPTAVAPEVPTTAASAVEPVAVAATGAASPAGESQTVVVTGPFSLGSSLTITWGSGWGTCTAPRTFAGTVVLNLHRQGDGSVSGTMTTTAEDSYGTMTCSGKATPFPPGRDVVPSRTVPVTGTASSFSAELIVRRTPGGTHSLVVTGALSDGVVHGTLTEVQAHVPNQFFSVASTHTAAAITLR